jgi:hypothetical protein
MTIRYAGPGAGSWRARQRARVRAWLQHERHPRLAVLLIVVLAGLAGLLASVVLRLAGLHDMWLRYPLAVLVAYGAFIGLFWVWLRRERVDGDVPDFSGLIPGQRGQASGDVIGKSGEFGGGGASGDFSASDIVSASGESAGQALPEAAAGGSGEILGAAGAAAGEGCGVVVLVGLVFVAIGAALWWMLSLAPVLATEVVIDALLAALLYRRLRRHNEPWLLRAIVRRTRVAFAVTAMAMSLAGAWMGYEQPRATTVGEFWTLRQQ